ncbi:MAG TPA: hypothetical protein PLL00_10125 [Bacteroidia bacterium]|jgi:hypothetical protein|nr:hypothetical protein [Bacteroidia bacterium]
MNNKKEIVIDDLVFKFEYFEEQNLWYLGYNEMDLFELGYTTNITIEESNPDWEKVSGFLKFICSNKELFQKKVEISNDELKKLFKIRFDKIESSISVEDIFFSLSNVDYKSKSVEGGSFEYKLNFNIESKKDSGFFMYDTWTVSFRGDEIVEVKSN